MSASAVCDELRSLQRKRSVVIKSRIMQANRLQAIVAGTLGYTSGMAEKDRLRKFAEAAQHIKAVEAGGPSDLREIILTTLVGVREFDALQRRLEKGMVPLANELPVMPWVSEPAQRGFGAMNLAVVIGETGDLMNYPNPGKLWKRLGCAPYTFEGLTRMCSTWRYGKEGKLPACEWEEAGYSPRRRSIAYNVGEPLMKLNGAGPYRQRYDDSKAAIKAAHPDYSDKRCHLHGMLLATKLLLKNLWIEWHRLEGDPAVGLGEDVYAVAR